MAVEDESHEFKLSTYKALFSGGDEKKWWDDVFSRVTPAGMPRYKKDTHPKTFVTPMDFLKQKIEDKIKELIEKD